MGDNWYQDIVSKIIRDRHSNLSSLRNQVLVRGINQSAKLPLRYYTLLYNTFYIEILFC
jgi:hypothetical protein